VTSNGKRHAWRLVLRLPAGYDRETPALFEWLRTWLIPALLQAPMRISVEFRPPERSDLSGRDNPEDP
jgi:hypothetical protein